MNYPTININTPIEELQRIHKDIWTYAAEHGEKPSTPYTVNCVGCEYATLTKDILYLFGIHIPEICFLCPIKWPEGCSCYKENSIYDDWNRSRDLGSALTIRDLPFKSLKEILSPEIREIISKHIIEGGAYERT